MASRRPGGALARRRTRRAPATWRRASPGTRGESGIPCTVVVPDNAPETKLAAIERLGARIVKVPYDAGGRSSWTMRYPGMEASSSTRRPTAAVVAGNGTIGLEILEDLPDVGRRARAVGRRRLSCGIASALRGAGSTATVFACEVETAAPLTASLAAGRPRGRLHARASSTASARRSVLPEMWALALFAPRGIPRRLARGDGGRLRLSPSARASWRRAPAPLRSRRRCRSCAGREGRLRRLRRQHRRRRPRPDPRRRFGLDSRSLLRGRVELFAARIVS